MVCHLEAFILGGSTVPVKERRVLNAPKGLLVAYFDQIPVMIIVDVIVHFLFVGDATQVGIVRNPFVLRGQSNAGGSHLCCIGHKNIEKL